MTTIHCNNGGPQGAQRILQNLYRRKNDKEQLTMNLTEFKFYDYETKELRTIEPSPCRKYICICDSFGVIYVYKFFKNEFLYLMQLHAHVSESSIMSIMWISKKNRKKKHLFMFNDWKDYVLAITTLCGQIVLYDLESKNILHSVSSNGSISCTKLNNSLQYLGVTNLDGYFYLYNIYSNVGSRIYNCFDRFHEGGAANHDAHNVSDLSNVSDDAYNSEYSEISQRSDDDAEERPGKRIKLSSDLTQYVEEEEEKKKEEKKKEEEDASSQGEDAESAPAVNPKGLHVFSPTSQKREKNKQTGEKTFNIFITNRFKCKEKLVCLYFVDELKNTEVLLRSVQGGEKKKTKVIEGEIGSEEDESDHEGNYHHGGNDVKESTLPLRRKKIREIERSYHSYNHYVLLGSEESKIYKYNITRKMCEGEFKGVNENCIIWDVLYIYKTDEVVCVDNSGSLTIFDNSSFSVKYFFNHHLYKSVSLAKTLNEDYIFTAGVDRYIIKYALTRVRGGRGGLSHRNIEQQVPTWEKRNYKMVNNKMNGHKMISPYSSMNGGNGGEEELFFLHKVKEEKELNKRWYRINKRSTHFSDIKRIILLTGNLILSISDDMTFCLYDTFNQISKYIQIGNVEMNRNVYFSSDLKSVFCTHAWGISIHCNNSSLCVERGRNDGLLAPKYLDKLSQVNYKHIANISYGKNEFVNSCIVNESGTKIACRTNRKLSIYHFNRDDLTIYNYAISKLGAFKVYAFDFVDEDLMIISFARRHLSKGGEKKEGVVGEDLAGEDVAGEDLAGEYVAGEDDKKEEMYELYEHVEDDEMDGDGNRREYLYTYHVAIYKIEKKKVKEEIQVDRILCNLKKYNNGKLIICTDEQKNIFLFFKNSKKYLKRCFRIFDFNLSRRNIHRSYLFSIVIENLFFIFTLDNCVYIYSLSYGKGNNLSFLKTQVVRNYKLSEYRDISLIDLGLCQGGVEYPEGCTQKMEGKNVGDQVDVTKHSPYFQSKYCLLLRGCDKMRIIGLNISNNLFINVQLPNVENAFKYSADMVAQYYISSLSFRYNFLNTKQIYFEDANLFNILLREMRREETVDRLDMADEDRTYNALKEDKALTGGEYNKEEEFTQEKDPINTDLLQLSFQSIKYLKKKNILNVRTLCTSQNNIVLLLCVPQNIDCTLISVADTKKYVE
ncbi:conserved Plasmodium protein, unknown function [Plasmodium knowlesi strain H]|uniref:U3 small nucleolar RNA-associated protein 4 n=3 Tax=Plasmodium knowlesi TaxID=5850 RepID=A0A5K1US94_PLAKH|nr:U3 small nucleolar RNA-associated protein 4, putative [Plasmodium knowlesi strain H]OTN66390.1 Uncharacterized protein PKNOH_S09531900 [Plasmodium knowlesi]CAA9989988.1 U3 small nucleolar RNA-associated protein 4, putative [Plasmodium knowlesi strain H]SBO24581.1 conserved Plasmodium protein, unknown function [Plasmodium knowlesi strain H]SBO26289.1 conserved Plasmodium protein, unknown function [Plasmodium knowlesi strain H]VVS79462.1 U3 small nucleolar RNA-associated protein 4, putative [|eukprot:XP_002260003.1 hypothetical protein, conserved in Plasmodium species [Plasmodium knowlesi strain H]